jgi:hypothetical protein
MIEARSEAFKLNIASGHLGQPSGALKQDPSCGADGFRLYSRIVEEAL